MGMVKVAKRLNTFGAPYESRTRLFRLKISRNMSPISRLGNSWALKAAQMIQSVANAVPNAVVRGCAAVQPENIGPVPASCAEFAAALGSQFLRLACGILGPRI